MQLTYVASVVMLDGLIEGNMLTCSRPCLSPWHLDALMTLPLCSVVTIRPVSIVLLRLMAMIVPECEFGLVMNGWVHLSCLVYLHSSVVDRV